MKKPIWGVSITDNGMEWTGLGCDVCGYGTVENLDEYDPTEPCPECGRIMDTLGVTKIVKDGDPKNLMGIRDALTKGEK